MQYMLLEASAAKKMDVKQIIFLVGFVFVFYFFMIRPQQKRQKEQRSFLDSIKKGDDVVTVGGIHGKVYEINDQVIILETDNKGSKITVSRNAINIEANKRIQPFIKVMQEFW
eukprot:gene92-121_t